MLFCVATSSSEIKEIINLPSQIVDGIEIRFDLIDSNDLEEIKEIIKRKKLKILITLRPERQGGNYRGDEGERLNTLIQLACLNPDYIDLEYDVPLHFWKEIVDKFPHIKFICSFHDFVNFPKDLDQLLVNIKNPYAHIYKIAVAAQSSVEALKMMHFVKKNSNKANLIGISMGERGSFSRILGPVVGNCLEYSTVTKPRAPGQISLEELEKIYNYPKLNSNTDLYGLIGFPVDKSLGDRLHNLIFQTDRNNAVYVKIALLPEEIASFFEIAKKLPFKGFSVTMPLKELVIPYLDMLAPSSKAIGAVNTISVENGKLIGENTDGIGALNAIENKIKVAGKHLVVVGAGGAAKAIVYEAVRRGARVTIINRTSEKAKQMAKIHNCEWGGLDIFPRVFSEGYDILIKSVPDDFLIKEEWILPNIVAMDVVYVPKNTAFLLMASNKNCKLVFGYEMFMEQAIQQQLIWFPGKRADRLEKFFKQNILP